MLKADGDGVVDVGGGTNHAIVVFEEIVDESSLVVVGASGRRLRPDHHVKAAQKDAVEGAGQQRRPPRA